jgi:hypothetical protein
MSGGPAFDDNGFLIGLVSSSFEGETSGPSYVSLLWPALAEPISPGWPSGFYGGATTLLQMDRRICGIQRPEALQVTDDGSGRAVVTYHPWE